MKSFGETIRLLRQKKKLPLRTVAAYLDIDQAILSKLERGQRTASREQVLHLAHYYKVKENDLLIAWLSDNLLYEVADESLGFEALQVAEEKLAYQAFLKIDRNKIVLQIRKEIKKFAKVQKAWIYGSFSRKSDGPKSDIDIAIKTDESFSYFDLAEIQHTLEKVVHRKIDLGFVDAFKPHVLKDVKADLRLIYER